MERRDLFPYLHCRPPSGWVNDPNGIGYWDERWHVMFQWNPDGPTHANIHWGHMSSPDLLHWFEERPSLGPRRTKIDDSGVWSGVAVHDKDEIALVYTAVPTDVRQAAVAVARRNVAGGWNQPIGTATRHPDHAVWKEVRDPYVVTIGGSRFGIVGAARATPTVTRLASDGSERPCSGVVLIYDATDLDEWILLGELSSADSLPEDMARAGKIWECPQLVFSDGKWVLVVSWDDGVVSNTSMRSGAPTQGVACFVGSVNVDGDYPRFVAETEHVLDDGPDFYAPQIVHDGDRLLMWGWAWEGRGSGTNAVPAGDQERTWAGTLTFPREITVAGDGTVRCIPARELVQLCGDELLTVRRDDMFTVDTTLNAWAALDVHLPSIECVDIVTGEARRVWSSVAAGSVSVFVDGSIVEVFHSSGSATMRAYPLPGEAWRVSSPGEFTAVELRLPEEPPFGGRNAL